MSKQIESAVWRSDLRGDLKPLAAVMADMGNDEGRGIYPSVAYLAWLLGWSERSVQRGLKELSELAIVQRVANVNGGRNMVPHYYLNASKLPERPTWQETRKGDNLSPKPLKGDNLTPFSLEKGDTSGSERVTAVTLKGDKRAQKGDSLTPDPLVRSVSDPLVEYAGAKNAPDQTEEDLFIDTFAASLRDERYRDEEEDF